jgi:hypothetical protein
MFDIKTIGRYIYTYLFLFVVIDSFGWCIGSFVHRELFPFWEIFQMTGILGTYILILASRLAIASLLIVSED